MNDEFEKIQGLKLDLTVDVIGNYVNEKTHLAFCFYEIAKLENIKELKKLKQSIEYLKSHNENILNEKKDLEKQLNRLKTKLNNERHYEQLYSAIEQDIIRRNPSLRQN